MVTQPSEQDEALFPEPPTATATLGGELLTLPLDAIKPYWRNPRRVTDEAVDAVALSIENYGYQQPIVVDAEHVIIVGHTRYQALRRLGATTAAVLVAANLSPERVKQYRLVDNKTGELSSWDFEKLVTELGQLDASLMTAFFPELSAESGETFGSDTIDTAPGTVEGRPMEFVCPHCYHSWDTVVSPQQVIEGRIPA